MAQTTSGLPFDGTPEQAAELKEYIGSLKEERGALMPVMQKAQEIYGYLPRQVQEMIAEEMGVPLTDVYGVATFYAMFSLQKSGKRRVSLCMGTACYVRGVQAVLDELEKQLGVSAGQTTADGLFTLDATRCLGCCGLAPVMTVGEEVYGRLEAKDVKGILDKYKEQQ